MPAYLSAHHFNTDGEVWVPLGCNMGSGNPHRLTGQFRHGLGMSNDSATCCAAKCGVATELCSKCYCQSLTEGLDVSTTQLKGEQGIGRGVVM
jgi:hypothetical protein